jgi:biopolymer transport protein ExbB
VEDRQLNTRIPSLAGVMRQPRLPFGEFMSSNTFTRARTWAKKAAATALAGLILTLSLPHLALAQAASEPAAAAAPAPAPEPAPAMMPAVAKESVANPYGLEALWQQGDFVARGTLIIMVIMSMGSWYIIFTKLFEQRKLMKSAEVAAKKFWAAGSVKDGIGSLEAGSAFRYIAESGVDASEHHEGTLVEQIDLHTWVSMSVQRAMENINSRLQDGLAFLATVGSTAPFVGLFGTVWGIYHALTAIGISGQASIDKVAGPVGEALIMTAFGLAVAVPAVMGYNWLIRRNKSAMERVRAFGSDVHNVLIAGRRN